MAADHHPTERHSDEIERPDTAISVDTTEIEDNIQHDEKVVPHQDDALTAQPDPEGGDVVAAAAQTGVSPERSASRASSTRSRALSVVPRAKRRGLFAQLAITPEVSRPYDYKNSTKWAITATVALATLAAPLGSSIFYREFCWVDGESTMDCGTNFFVLAALKSMNKEFHTSSTITNLSVALYMLAMAIFPLWWSSFSEEFGRRSIYLISFMLFIVFSILCAVSQNIAMLIVFRVMMGGASGSVQAVGAGTIADIWEPVERGRAMSIFYLGPLLGPIVSPLVGGALTLGFGWRACMYFLAIYGLVVVVMLLLFLPETLARRRPERLPSTGSALQRVSTRESVKVHSKRMARGVKRFVIDPLHVLLFLQFPPVLITVVVAAIAFGALFVANIAMQQKYSEAPYNYSQILVGVTYLAPGVGYFLASFFGGPWLDRIMAREARKANRYDEHGKLIYLPEDRMRENIWFANSMYPAGLLIFGWTINYGVIVVAPLIGSFLFGISSMLVFVSELQTIIVEQARKLIHPCSLQRQQC